MTTPSGCGRVIKTGASMKQIVPVIASLALVACGQPSPEAQEPPKAPTPPPAPSAPRAPEPPPGSAAVIVPVGDHNPLGIPPAVYPPLPARFAEAAAVTPKGWRVEHRVEGDLNGDRRPDLVLVLRQQNPANLVRNDGLGGDSLDTNPRRLVVGLARDGGYDLAVQNHTFIPRHVEPVLSDALEQPPDIRNGVLSIRLDFFASAGGWTMFNSTARFRWQDGALRLIGHDYSEVARNTGETLDRSVNFLTRRVSTVRSSIEVDENPPPVWTRLPLGPLLTIDQIGNGLEFDPTGSAGG